ncbi:thermolysin [unidentified eubacterium SCB49]|nr:thermolysin [unidentified eubacterium SCB49]
MAQTKNSKYEKSEKTPSLIVLNDAEVYKLQDANQIFRDVLGSQSEVSFLKIKENTGSNGSIHQKFQQYYRDVKVEGGIGILHGNNARVKSVSSEFYKINKDFSTLPTLNNQEAFDRAIVHTGATLYLWEDEASAKELGYEKPNGELVLLPTFKDNVVMMKLAYKFKIFTLVPMGGGELFIDANTGEALFFNNLVKHYDNAGHDGSSLSSGCSHTVNKEPFIGPKNMMVAGDAETRYSGTRTIETRDDGTSYSLNDVANKIYTRNANNLGPGNGVPPYIANYTEFTDNDNNWTASEHHNTAKDDAALDAHWGAMMVYNYWITEHNRDSYDGSGSSIRSYVHVDTDYDNAFWYYNTMSYGDGSGNENNGSGIFDALTSLDVAAHELGHGVTEYSANLAYQRESGAMNEGYSDIWGAAIEHYAKGTGTDLNPDANVWNIGEEIIRNGSIALRSMSDPKSLGQPDTYGGTYWINPNCSSPSSSNDYCGVHTNSGVLNYWFYLSVTGGSGTNDVGDSYNVSGIGMTKASLIAYDVLENYLGTNSTHANARTFSIQSAIDLYGECSPEVVTITNAWYAVGVGDAYTGNSPSLNLTLETVCVSAGNTVIGGGTVTGGVYSGDGVTDNGDGTTFTFDPSVAGVGTHTITYTINCGAGSASDTDEITVTDGAIPLVCQNVTVTLDENGNASITETDVVANFEGGDGSLGYEVDQTGTYNPIDISGGTVINLDDDAGSSAIPLGYTFDFFGTGYTNLYVGSNGYIKFDSGNLTDYSSDALPNTSQPNGIIAVVWDDLNPSSGGVIRYQITGTAPNRIMVVEYVDVPHFGSTSLLINTQVQLFEGSNKIEIHSNRVDSDGGNRTQGIENEDGTIAYTVPGRNLADWTIPTGGNDYVAFVPVNGGFPEHCGNPVTISLSQSSFSCKDIGDVTVTVTADDGAGGIGTCEATVTVVGATSTFTESGWDVPPSTGSKAVIDAPYITSVDGNLDVCSCELNADLSIAADDYVKIEGNLKVNSGSHLYIAHTGSLVQVDDNAVVTNEGDITVNVTTPFVKPRDIILSGSPMSGETRSGVYDASFRVLEHKTLDFFPHPDVIDYYAPSIVENFTDDNFNDWAHYTGAIHPGEGFMVYPQASYEDGNSTYEFYFTEGTLNNGVVTYAMDFHVDKNSSPNLISNPYASAIDAEMFILENSAIDEVYFWEHITTPGNFPGGNTVNFSLEDVSMYNLSGGIGAGTAATNGGTTPNGIIATSQGFGVKTAVATNVIFNNSMRVTTGNNTLRVPNTQRDRIWLNVLNETYGLSSEILIAFTDNATIGFDQGYDSRQVAKAVSIYSHLENDNSLLGIQAREALTLDKEVSLGFSTLNEELDVYSISIKQLEGLKIEGFTVYLEDHLTGVIANISESDYSFTAIKGVYDNRFTLRFKDKDVLDVSAVSLQDVTVNPNPTEGKLFVLSPNVEIDNISVRDVQGRIIAQYNNVKAFSYSLDISDMSSAMYFVSIKTQDGSITKRIVKK